MQKNIAKILILFLFLALNIDFVCAQASLSQINSQRTHAKNKIYKLRLLEKIETNKLYSNQQKLEKTEQNLLDTKAKLTKTQAELKRLEYQLDHSTDDYRELNNAINKRIVQIFKTQRKNYLEFLLNANNINSFLDRLYFEDIIMKQDRARMSNLHKKTKHILDLKARIQLQKMRLADSAKVMDKEQQNIQVAIKRNQQMIEKIKTDRVAWERAERNLANDSARLTAMLNRTNSARVPVARGTFVRPVYGGITSYYGWRTHPIFKRRIFHSGVDIGAPMRTPVKAANNGNVIFTGWYGGYGNVVIIDHGMINGRKTTTLYAHLSRIKVSKGQSVSKGQVVGAVGTTGYSTGPHLHFEVRLNGSTVNPLNYIPG